MFYYSNLGGLFAVELEFEPERRVVSRRRLFSLLTSEGLLTGGSSFHPDRGFVMELRDFDLADLAEAAPRRVYLVVNWFRELRELVGNQASVG